MGIFDLLSGGSQGGPLSSLLGGGQTPPMAGTQPMAPMAGAQGGGGLLGGLFDMSDPNKAAAWTLLTNSLTPSPVGTNVFKGVPEAAQAAQLGQFNKFKMQQAQQEVADNAAAKNKTSAWLMQNKPQFAPLIDAGMAPADVLKLALDPGNKTKKFMQLDDGTIGLADEATGEFTATGKYAKPGTGGSTVKYGLNPQTGVDAAGNPVLIQLGEDGSGVRTKLPDGVSLSKAPIKLDAGDHFVLLDPVTRQPVGTVPKNLYDAASQTAQGKEFGENEGKMNAAAAQDYQAGQNALDTIDEIRNDPYKARGTGGTSIFNSIPGTGGADFQNKVNAAKAGSFLTAIQQMRGLGSLSDAEGAAATKAVNRLNTATSEEEFNSSLEDYEKIVRQGMARAKARLPGSKAPAGAAPAAAAPAASTTKSGISWSAD